MTPETTRKKIRQALKRSGKGPLKAKELARRLEVPTDGYRAFKDQLRDMETAGEVYRVKGQRYALPGKINLTVGQLSITRKQDGFVIPEGGGRDVFVPAAFLDSAMDGDQVVVRIEAKRRGKAPEGRVIKVLKRAHTTVVGTFREARRFAHVVPLDERLSRDVLVPSGEEGDASEGDIVVARISTFGDRRRNPTGTVERVLGPLTEPGVDVLAILFGYGLELEFPPEVEEAAQEMVRKEGEGGVGWPSGSNRSSHLHHRSVRCQGS